ncbi:hypothetical protein SY86_18920 [Erwinia tracheiphila]|uniref:Uncharacterized protein n=1 Tax=Erwinia tracheiphila TaxID=65700 RepID=A0A0M2KCE0_9GAMM|nr:hypothetical protein SY86_18920 [Erwinia tracheiphila]
MFIRHNDTPFIRCAVFVNLSIAGIIHEKSLGDDVCEADQTNFRLFTSCRKQHWKNFKRISYTEK